jgi:hypothetical protein
MNYYMVLAIIALVLVAIVLVSFVIGWVFNWHQHRKDRVVVDEFVGQLERARLPVPPGLTINR